MDFDLPEGMPKPSTKYITDEVVKMEVKGFKDDNPIIIIKDIYDILRLSKYPVPVNFEHSKYKRYDGAACC